jgi:siroheme synthase
MSDLQQTLRDLHRELAGARQIDPQDRAMLEAAIADIQQALAQPAAGGAAPDAPPPGEALEGAAVRLEAGHPTLAGAVRALVDALAKAGI